MPNYELIAQESQNFGWNNFSNAIDNKTEKPATVTKLENALALTITRDTVDEREWRVMSPTGIYLFSISVTTLDSQERISGVGSPDLGKLWKLAYVEGDRDAAK